MSLTFCDAIKKNFFVNNCVSKQKTHSIWPRPAHLSSLWRRHTLSSEGYSVHLHSETGGDRLGINRKDTHACPQGTNFISLDVFVTRSWPVLFHPTATGEWKYQLLLTTLWRKGTVEQVEALVSQEFIWMEVEGERRGVDSLFAAVWHWVA